MCIKTAVAVYIQEARGTRRGGGALQIRRRREGTARAIAGGRKKQASLGGNRHVWRRVLLWPYTIDILPHLSTNKTHTHITTRQVLCLTPPHAAPAGTITRPPSALERFSSPFASLSTSISTYHLHPPSSLAKQIHSLLLITYLPTYIIYIYRQHRHKTHTQHEPLKLPPVVPV
jgi:hypothetical protein